MAKQALFNVLESTIGKYVRDLDAEQLNVSIWNGHVELHDLQLDVDKCNAELARHAAEAPNLAIPLEVVHGKFARLQVEIPWSHLSSQSAVIKAHGLHIQVAPKDRTTKKGQQPAAADLLLTNNKEMSDEKRVQKIRQERMDKLQTADATRVQSRQWSQWAEDQQQSVAVDGDGKQQKVDNGFVSRLVRRIVENLQVEIDDVCVSLLDQVNHTHLGVQLEALNFNTTDMTGRRTFVDRTNQQKNPSELLNKFLYKALEIRGFGIYMDDITDSGSKEAAEVAVCEEKDQEAHKPSSDGAKQTTICEAKVKFGQKPTSQQEVQVTSGEDKDEQEQKPTHSYILSPLTFRTRLRQADASVCHEYPQYLLRSTLDGVKLAISERQADMGHRIMAVMFPNDDPSAMKVARPLFPEYRPLQSVSKGTAKDWWQYAYRGVGRLQGRRGWVEFLSAFRQRQKYLPLYKRHAHAGRCKWLKHLTMEEIATMKEIELDRTISIHGIMTWRNIADASFDIEQEKREKSKEEQKPKGLLSSLFGSRSGSSSSPDDPPISLTDDELKALHNVSLDHATLASDLTDGKKLAHVEFIWGTLDIQLCSQDDQPSLALEMGRVGAQFDATAGGAFDLKFQLERLDIFDHATKDTLFPKLLGGLPIREADSGENQAEDCFQFHVSMSQTGDKELKLKLIPFELVGAPHLLPLITKFLNPEVPGGSQSVENDQTTPEVDMGVQNYRGKTKAYTLLRSRKENKDEETGEMNGSVECEYYEGKSKGYALLKSRRGSNEANKETDNSDSSSGNDISKSLVEAWKAKTKEKTSLVLDLDIQAPILLLPENCTDAKATIIVLDLGGFRFRYGQIEPPKKVQKWLAEKPRSDGVTFDPSSSSRSQNTPDAAPSNAGVVLDSGTLEISHLTFVVGQSQTWNNIEPTRDRHINEHEAMIEPFSAQFDFAVESVVTSPIPRVCTFAEIPTAHFKMSPHHVSHVLDVYNVYMKALGELGSQDAAEDPSNTPISENTSPDGLPTRQTREVVSIQGDKAGNSVEATLEQDVSLLTTMFVDITLSRYSFIFFDAGELISSEDWTRMSATTSHGIAEGLMLAGGVNLTVELANNAVESSIATVIQGQGFEICCGFGPDLHQPIQILEPMTGTIGVTLTKQADQQKTAIDVAMQTPVDLSISMRNLQLVNYIISDVSECLESITKQTESAPQEQLVPLDANQERRLSQIAFALEHPEEEIVLLDRTDESDVGHEASSEPDSASVSVTTLIITFKEASLTIINDLQGIDEALFRIDMNEFATKAMVASTQDQKDSDDVQTTFDFKLRATFRADYYDSSVIAWKPLLRQPWEMMFDGQRAPGKGKDGRFSTRLELKSKPFVISFSDHFLVSLGGLQRMLSSSSDETKDADPEAGALRHEVKALPYAIRNNTGLDAEFLLAQSRIGKRQCPSGQKVFFKFNPPKGTGYGGKRRHGQYVVADLSVEIFIGGSTILIKNVDTELKYAKKVHCLSNGAVIYMNVVKLGNTTMIRLSSPVSIANRSPVPVCVQLVHLNDVHDVGVCRAASSLNPESATISSPYDVRTGTFSKPADRVGVPVEALACLRKEWAEKGKVELSMTVSPNLESAQGAVKNPVGILALNVDMNELVRARHTTIRRFSDVVCQSDDSAGQHFVFKACIDVELFNDNNLSVVVTLQPRALLGNAMPVALTLTTKTPHSFSASSFGDFEKRETVHTLLPGDKIEIYSPGDTFFVKAKCMEEPVGGTKIGMSQKWAQIPLTSEVRLEQPLKCLFPFEKSGALSNSAAEGSEFYIAEAGAGAGIISYFAVQNEEAGKGNPKDNTERSKRALELLDGQRLFLATLGDYGVDHTKTVLFEQVDQKSPGLLFVKHAPKDQVSFPFSTFELHSKRYLLSLLPPSDVPLRLLASRKGKTKKSMSFRAEDISLCSGGAQATPIFWDNGETPSGFFAYRKLVNLYQTEIHIIPEFLIFNGSLKHAVTVKQDGSEHEKTIDAGKTAPIYVASRKKGLSLSFVYSDIRGSTKSMRLDELGAHIALIEGWSGHPIGSVAVQTAIGSQDSRLVVKLGEVGSVLKAAKTRDPGMWTSIKYDDELRLRIFAEQFELTLNEHLSLRQINDEKQLRESQRQINDEKQLRESQRQNDGKRNVLGLSRHESGLLDSLLQNFERPVCTVEIRKCVHDFQRRFKDKEELSGDNDTPERCQLSLIVGDFQIRDDTPGSSFPIVFRYNSPNHFLDFCLRTKGRVKGDFVTVDLFDLVLANGFKAVGTDDKIYLETSEEFVWKLIDLAGQISQASQMMEAGTDHDQFIWEYSLPTPEDEPEVVYTPPRMDSIYDIATARVSPFTLLVTFKRRPQAERYEHFVDNEGARLMRYFTQQLKFTIDKCKLKFSHYEANNLKGPPDRLTEILATVYISRVKLKLVTILTASSFADWKNLASRDDGDDEFVEGDVLRITGRLAGNSVGYVFSKVGRGVGDLTAKGFEFVGRSVEETTALVGARKVGAGVNVALAGVGGSIGGTLTGVGEGASDVFRGAGKGMGKFFGGIAGGGSQIAKGLGKGIVTFDGESISKGFKQGVHSMKAGVKNSVTTVGEGVGSGVQSVGRETVSGLRGSLHRASVSQHQPLQGSFANLSESDAEDDK